MIRRRERIGRMDRDWMSERLNVIPFEKLRLKIRYKSMDLREF